MHWGLRSAVVIAIAAFLVHAGFTQAYETGYGRVLSPAIALGVAALLVAFLRRRPWSWRWVLWYAIGVVVINLAFLPQQEHFGVFLIAARILVGIEITASAIILAFMLHPASKGRFHGSSAS
jgi:hypothetical protein